MVASGIRVGSAAVTTQGMGQGEMADIARLIAAAVKADHTTDAGRRRARSHRHGGVRARRDPPGIPARLTRSA